VTNPSFLRWFYHKVSHPLAATSNSGVVTSAEDTS
jgi:hypothetical protein